MVKEYETAKETAKKIRQQLKKNFPELPARHFKVKTDKLHVYVFWEDYPNYETVNSIVKVYNCSKWDSYSESYDYTGYTDPETGEHITGYSHVDVSFNLSLGNREFIKDFCRKKLGLLPQDYNIFEINAKYNLGATFLGLNDKVDINKSDDKVLIEAFEVFSTTFFSLVVEHLIEQKIVSKNYLLYSGITSDIMPRESPIIVEFVTQVKKYFLTKNMLSYIKKNYKSNSAYTLDKYRDIIKENLLMKYMLEIPLFKKLILNFKNEIYYELTPYIYDVFLKDISTEDILEELCSELKFLKNYGSFKVKQNTSEFLYDFYMRELDDFYGSTDFKDEYIFVRNKLKNKYSNALNNLQNKVNVPTMDTETINLIKKEYAKLNTNEQLSKKFSKIAGKQVNYRNNLVPLKTILMNSSYYSDKLNLPTLIFDVDDKARVIYTLFSAYVIVNRNNTFTKTKIYSMTDDSLKDIQLKHKKFTSKFIYMSKYKEFETITDFLVSNLSLRRK